MGMGPPDHGLVAKKLEEEIQAFGEFFLSKNA